MLDLNEIKRKVKAGKYDLSSVEVENNTSKNTLAQIKQKVKNGEYDFGIDNNYIQSYISDANKYLSDIDAWHQNKTYKGIQDRYNSTDTIGQDLVARGDNIKAYLNANKNRLSKEQYDKLSQYLFKVSGVVSSDKMERKTDYSYISQFKDENEYNYNMLANKYNDSSYTDISDAINKATDETEKSYLQKIKYNKAYHTHEDYDSIIADIDAEMEEIKNRVLVDHLNNAGIYGGAPKDNDFVSSKANLGLYQANNQETATRTAEETKAGEQRLEYLKTLKTEMQYAKDMLEFTETPRKLGENMEVFKEDLPNKLTQDRFKNPTLQELEDWSAKEVELRERYKEGTDSGQWSAYLETQPQIKDPLGFVLDNPDAIGQYHHSSDVGQLIDDVSIRGKEYHWDQITEDEKVIYYYTLSTMGKGKALEYLKLLEPTFGKRYEIELNEAFDNALNKMNGLEKVALDLLTIPAKAVSGALVSGDNTVKSLTGKEVNPYSSLNISRLGVNAIRTQRAQDIAEDHTWTIGGKNVLAEIYQLGMSLGDVTFSSFVLKKLPFGMSSDAVSNVYSFIASSGAAADAAQDIYDRGGSASEIFWGSTVAGVTEALFEKFSLEKFSKGTAKITGLKSTIKQVFKQAGIEASEEMFTEIANSIFDDYNMDEKSKNSLLVKQLMADNPDMTLDEAEKAVFKQNVTDVIWSAVGGFLSGGAHTMLSAPLSIRNNNIRLRSVGEQVVKKGYANDLVSYIQNSNNKSLRKLLSNTAMADNLSTKKLGELYDSVYENIYDTLSKTDSAEGLLKSVTDIVSVNAPSEFLIRTVGEVATNVMVENPGKYKGVSDESISQSAEDGVFEKSQVENPDSAESITSAESSVDGETVVGDEVDTDYVDTEPESVLPDVSAVDSETDSYRNFVMRQNGTLELTDDQKFIQSVGEAFGRKVRFANIDKSIPQKDGTRKLFSPNGYFDKTTGEIVINTSTAVKHNALEFILKHELTHFAETDSAAYTDFANGIMDSEGFKAWVKSKGFKDSDGVSATMAMNADYIKRYTDSRLPGTKDFDEGKANLEMVADFVAENLFVDDMSRLKNALSNVKPEVTNKFKRFILSVLEKLKNIFKKKLKGFDTIVGIESEFVKTCEAAQKAWEQKNADNKKSTDEGGKEYSIFTARADVLDLVQKVKDGNFKANEKIYFDDVSDGLASKIESLTGINVKGFKVAIEARQIEHILKDHGENGKSDHSMSSDEDIAKMEYVLKKPDDLSLSGKTQAYSYMKNGYNKTADTVLYEKAIGDKSYYVVQAIPDTKAKTLYVVSAFIGERGYKKETSQLINAKSPDATAKSGSVVVSNNSIDQNEPSVNSNSTQESEEYSENREFSLPDNRNELLKQYRDGQLTEDELLEQLESTPKKEDDLFDAINMTEEDISTTPKTKPKKEFRIPTKFKMLLTGKDLNKADKTAVINILDSLSGQQRNDAISFVRDLLRVEKDGTSVVRRLNDYIKEKHFDLSNSYDSLLGSSIFDDNFKSEIKNNDFIKKYETVTNKATLEQAAKELDDGGQAYVLKWLRSDAQHASLIDEAVGFILLYRYQRVGDYESATAVAQKLKEMGTAAGQSVQIFSILGRFDPDMMVVYAQKELAGALERARDDRTNRWLKKNAEKFRLTPEDIEFIRRRTLQAAELPEGRTRNVVIAEIAQRLRDKLPPQKGQSVKAYQRICMLLNVKTNERNALSNIASAPLFMFQDVFGTVADMAASYYVQKKGLDSQRTTAIFGRGGMKENIKAFGRGAYESYDDWRRHINTRQSDGDRYSIEGQGKSFNENTDSKIRNAVAHTFNELDRLTSFLLDAGDRPFYEMWYTNSLNNQLKVNKVTEPTPQMLEIATQEALDRTWQNNNAWTRSAKKAKDVLNTFNLNKLGFQTDYGIGDIIVKFTKTPANLSRAIFQFSPAGLVQAVAKDGRDFREMVLKGKYDPMVQKRFVDGLAKGIAGTLVQVLLYSLAKLGFISLTGGNDEDKDVRSFENYILGMPEYSIKIGGTYFSYEWIQPAGAFMAGIADYMDVKEKHPENEWYDNLWTAITAGGDVLMRQSFVQGIQEFFEAEGFVNKFVEAVLGDPSVYVPQLLAQTASIFDDKKRVVYTNDKVESTINSVLYKIPGLRNTLEKDVDVLGRTVDNAQSDVLNSFFNPANTYTDTSNDVADEVYRIYTQTGEKTVFPKKAANSIKIKEVSVPLDTKQKLEFQRIMGTVSNDLIDEALDNALYDELTDEQKALFVEDIYNYATAKAKSQILISYEALSAMYGKDILTKSYYDSCSDKVKKAIASEHFMDTYSKAYKIELSGGSVAEYYLKKLANGKKSNKDADLKKKLDNIVEANS